MKFSIINGCHLLLFKIATIHEIQYGWECSPPPLCKFSNFQIFQVFQCSFHPPSLHVNYRVREPHVSHTGINVYAHCPFHLPKIVTEKLSVNHIGSSMRHQQVSQMVVHPTGMPWLGRSLRCDQCPIRSDCVLGIMVNYLLSRWLTLS